MQVLAFISVFLVVAAKTNLESEMLTKVGSAVFRRQCDAMCSQVSDWFDSSDAARRACVNDHQCLGIVDHSANDGRVGVCLSGSMFTQGSQKAEPFRRVCVEYKGDASAVGPVNLLQLSEGPAKFQDEEAAQFSRECDMMCDESYAFFTTLDAARKACSVSNKCSAVVDHSGNHGSYGLCSASDALFRGSQKHEAFRAVCIERKRVLVGDNVNFLQVSLADAPAMTARSESMVFQRNCNMICDKVSDWFDSLALAKDSCTSSADCSGIVDHSANRGRFGLCSKGATFARGSDKAPTYQAVCVEHKVPLDHSASLLQTSNEDAFSMGTALSATFERECNMVCDKVSEWFEDQVAAQQFCGSVASCSGVVDHTANKGLFGACAKGARFTRGDERHDAYRVVCVDHKVTSSP